MKTTTVYKVDSDKIEQDKNNKHGWGARLSSVEDCELFASAQCEIARLLGHPVRTYTIRKITTSVELIK